MVVPNALTVISTMSRRGNLLRESMQLFNLKAGRVYEGSDGAVDFEGSCVGGKLVLSLVFFGVGIHFQKSMEHYKRKKKNF